MVCGRVMGLDRRRAGRLPEPVIARCGHFMPPSLLDTQFATLEPPGPDARLIAVAIELSPEEIIKRTSGVLLSSRAPGNPARPSRGGTSDA